MSNSLASVHPELIPEWSERNLPLTPDKITFGSNKRVWWKGACGHEWETSVKARSKGEKCPICSGARVIEGINDLATLKPLLAQEWSEKNKLKPTEISVASHKKIIWKCKHGHEWEASVKSRTINGTGCPYCSHNKVLAGFNDLASQYPDIAAEWSDRNLPLLPTMVTAFANSKVWWKCRDCGNEWYTLISTRSGGSRCPYCSGYTLLKGFNDLATTHPDLAAEWSERNYPLMPDEVNAKSRHNVWWKCKTCGNEWKSVINARVKGTVCPVCADRAVLVGYNDLATTDRKLLAEWDYEKNSLLPAQVSRRSMKSVWWKCSLGHSWKAKISDRTIIGEKCTVCENEYRSVFPGLAVAYYANQKGLKVQLGSDKLLGIPLETYIPSEKLAIEFTNGSEHMEVLKSHLCKQRNIKLVKLPFKTTETEAEYKYVTISINKKSVEDARTYFARVGADLIAHFARLGSKCVELETDERLRIVHDFFRVGEETAYHFNIKETRKKGHDFKDYVCPDTMEFEKDYFKMGNRYGRVLFLREYASYIKDSMVAELTDLNRNLMMSIDIVPVPTDEAVREAESRLLGVETNITNWQRKQNQNNNFSATVPYDMEQQKKEMKEFLDDLTTRDQRMMFAVLTMVHTADSKEQLDNDTEALLTTARKHLCQFAVLKYQQMDGLNTAMPFGTRKIDAFRTLTTESLAVFIPFRVQDIYHENGIYYGQNVISKNMIIADRRQLLNGNSFILGVSGGGKSFAAKGEIENIILSSNADVIIIDPEREYSQLVKALGGEIINISATSPSHINAMDMNKEYGDGANPVILKSEFIMSLCEQLIGGTNLGAKQKSIIDRCTASVYRDYQQRGYTGTVPTLQDFRAELLKQDEPEAKEIALAIELFTHGSLNTFAKPTNVDTDNRLICYDILDLGKQLMPIGMLVVLDSILNRITQNRAKGKQTFIFIDEIYLLFQHEYSANFLFTLWKRVRKYGAYATGITQNVDDLLQSHTARTMLANSEFLIMLNQASTDRIELAKLLNISDLQLSYITNVDAGHGLIKVGSSLVPFANKFPKNTKLYKLMTTKPGEGA